MRIKSQSGESQNHIFHLSYIY